MLDCPDLAVPTEIMHHVVHVESSRNPYAIGVVGGRLSRQPRTLDEALEAVRALKEQGYNFSVGIAQVNRYNLARYGLTSYDKAFELCPNLRAGSQILKECHDRARDWGKAFSCYYSGNFVTGFEHGYVQKVFDSMARAPEPGLSRSDIAIIARDPRTARQPARDDGVPLRAQSTGSASPSASTAALTDIPTQVVGTPADPYQVRLLKPPTRPVQRAVDQAHDRMAGARQRGGTLLEPNSTTQNQAGARASTKADTGPSVGSVGTTDRSFVF